VVTIPTNRRSLRVRPPDRCYPGEAAKWQAVAEQAKALSGRGIPVLVGTRSLEASERLSAVLTQHGLAHRVLNARQDAGEADVVAQAGMAGAISVATNMAGRGTDIRLGPGVADSGGLHVILTEFHDSPRVDRQLIGRCARQGDPGCAIVITSLEDALFTEHGGWLQRLMCSVWRDGLQGRPLSLLRKFAQAGAENIHARARRDTLKQDRNVDTMLAFAGNQI